MKPIFYFCPDNRTPSGGVKVIYEHVDILNAAGIRSYVVHVKRGFRCSWFKNTTPILYPRRAFDWISVGGLLGRVQGLPRLSREDFLADSSIGDRVSADGIWVLPEFYGKDIGGFIPKTPKVVLNQGVAITFRDYAPEAENPPYPYQNPEVIAAVCVSEGGLRNLSYAFPKLKIGRVYNSIDPQIFFRGGAPKPQIAFMPRRGESDAREILNTLKARGSLDGFRVVAIRNKSREEVGTILRESQIFISTSANEGFGLPAAEAMACGCIVVGYHGGGGKEFFKEDHCFPVEGGDIFGFAKCLDSVLGRFREKDPLLTKKSEAAAAFIAAEYSTARQRESVLKFWNEFAA